jgi:hypothetical protein
MLPNYPKEKREFMEHLVQYMKYQVAKNSPFLSKVSKVKCFEGNKQLLHRADGSIHKSSFQEIMNSLEFDYSELEDIDLNSLIKKLEQSAKGLSHGQEKMAFKHINEVVEEVGNVVDGKGRPFSYEMVLKLLDRILIEFDDSGSPVFPTLVVPPEIANKTDFRKVYSELESDPRFEELMAKKKEEYRDRENSRCLVG